LAFRLGPRLRWSPEKWRALEEIAAEFGLRIEHGNLVHLREMPANREIASIRDMALENDIAIHPGYARAGDLLRALGERVFGASATGPVEWIDLHEPS